MPEGKIGKHSLDHITEIKNLKKLQTVRISHEVTNAADHHQSEETVAAVERDILPDKQGKEITKDFTTNLRDALAGVEKGVVLSNPYYDEILPDVKTDMFEKGITRQEHEEILTSKLTKYLDILADEDTQVALDNKALEITKDVTTSHQETAVATTTLINITHKIKCKMGDRKCYQRGKIGKHSLDHIREIKNLKKWQTVISHEVTHAADHHPGEHEKEVVTYKDKEKLN